MYTTSYTTVTEITRFTVKEDRESSFWTDPIDTRRVLLREDWRNDIIAIPESGGKGSMRHYVRDISTTNFQRIRNHDWFNSNVLERDYQMYVG